MSDKDRLVWIDAICINQHDVDERNHQIALMRRIYTSAFRTIICIGDLQSPERPTCSRAFADDGCVDLTLCVHPVLAEKWNATGVHNAALQLLEDFVTSSLFRKDGLSQPKCHRVPGCGECISHVTFWERFLIWLTFILYL